MKTLEFFLFNKYTMFYYSFQMNESGNKIDKRLPVFILEGTHQIFILIPYIFVIAVTAGLITNTLGFDDNKVFFTYLMTVVQGALLIATLNKDFFNGQSIIHRIWGFKVVDHKTGNTATEFKCMIRNLTTIFMPIEFVFVLINRERRLGDFIAGTRLVKTIPTDPKSILTDLSNHKSSNSSIIALIVPVLIFIAWIVWGLLVGQ